MEKIRIGTRGSRLALAQTGAAALALENKGYSTEIVVVRTRGDENISASLSDIGRGAFTDIFSAMIERGEIDLAVHSAKDLPTGAEKDGFFCLSRADARDVVLSVRGRQTFRIGTGSPRRAAAIKKLYSSAEILPVRGNVDTRIKKMLAGEYDALVLAAAGLMRLGLLRENNEAFSFNLEVFSEYLFSSGEIEVKSLSPEVCVPAACQGIIALEGEVGMCINDEEVQRTARIERALQRALGGDCTGGAGAFFDGKTLFAQKDGRIETAQYEGEESILRLARKFE